MVGPSGLEPPTSCLSGTRSNLLSYDPMWLVSDLLSLGWWRWWDSNPWPPACRAGALPAELHPHFLKNRFRYLYLFSNLWSGFYSTPSVSVSIELFSRTVSRKVSSPLQSLTSVFGMGTGGPSAFVTLTLFSFLIGHWKLNNIISRSFLNSKSPSISFRLKTTQKKSLPSVRSP